MSEKTRKKINAEINKNLGDDPNRIVNKLKVDPRPTHYAKDQNRYSQILQTRKDEKRIREEQKLKIPHIANKKRLVKRWQAEAEELNLSPDEELELEEDENNQIMDEEIADNEVISKDIEKESFEEDLEDSPSIGDGIKKELTEPKIHFESEFINNNAINDLPQEITPEPTSLLQHPIVNNTIPEPSNLPPSTSLKTQPQKSNSSDNYVEPVVLVIKSGRITCPKCGNVNRNMMRELEDRSHIIMDYPLMFGRKYICGKCNTHFRKED